MVRISMWTHALLAIAAIIALQATGSDAAVCEPLAATSPCAQFYPAGTNVTYPAFSPTTPFNCQRDLDRLVFGTSTQTVWNVVSTLTAGTDCGMSVARLMCLTMYRPCADTVSDTVCSAAVGNSSSCPASIQSTLLPLLISSWPTSFASCTTSPAFSSTGVTGVAAPLILPRCEFLANNSVCKTTLNYPVYVPWKASQAALEAKASGTLSAALVGVTDPACAARIKSVVCSQVFTKCDTYALIEALTPLLAAGSLPPTTAGNLTALLPALQVAFPRLPCNGVCRAAYDTCGAETVAASPVLTGLLANNCSLATPGTILPPSLQCDGSAVPNTGQPNFPTASTTLGSATISGQVATITSSCNSLDNSPCMALPAASVCASFFPPGALVDVNPAFACYEDAEASLKSGPVVWDAIGMALAATRPNSTCRADFAQLMCFVVYKPCNSFVSRSFCQSVVGLNATSAGDTGSCPLSVQTGLLAQFIPGFASKFNCNLNPIFQPEPLGVGVQVTQPPRVPQAVCATLSSSSVCRGVVDYPIYLPWNYNGDQSRIEQQVSRTFSNAFLLANTQTGCVTSIQKMLCSMVYTRCDTTVLAASLAVAAPTLPPFPIPFPRLPCADLCATVQDQCSELLSNSPSLAAIANCTGVGFILSPTTTCGGVPVPGSAGANFPANSSVLASVTIGGVPVPIESQCNAFVSAYPSNATSVISCPFPLVGSSGPQDENAVFHGSCATPCPTFIFTESEYESGDRFFTGLTVTSFLMSTALWLTWVIFPVKRKQTNTLCFSTCTFLLSMAMIVIIGETDSRPSRVGCKNDSEFATQESGGVCIFQAIFFFYLTLAGVMFWLISALDLYIKIVLNKKIDLILQRKLNITYLAVGWGLPFIFLIAALSTKAFGGSTGTPWCFFSTNSREYLDWLLFYYPIIVLVFLGSFFMVSIIWKMIVSARLTGSTKRAGWWKTQIRPFVFVFIFILIFTFIFAYRVHIYFKTDAYRAAGKVWVNCMLNSGSSTEICGPKPADTPNVGLWFLIQLAVAGQGILNSIIFGSQRVNAVLWWGLLTGRGVTYNGTNASTGTQDTSKSERTTGNGSERSKKSGEARPHLARTNSGRLDLSRKEQESKGFASAASSPARRPGQHIAPVSAQGVAVGSYPYPQLSAAATPVAASTVPASPSAMIHPNAAPSDDPSQI